MSSIDRPLAGGVLRFALGAGLEEHIDRDLLARSGRSARTLVKDGTLRVTLVSLAPGGGLAPHHADGPITVHVLAGAIRFRAGEGEWELGEGDLLSLGGRVEHAVESASGGTFLLTVAARGA